MNSMKDVTKKYSNGEVTVLWKPGLCIHSEICFKGLPNVFKPKERPWIQMDGADPQTITDQVMQCPSGALSMKENQEENNGSALSIQVMEGGPLLVKGEVTIQTGSGKMQKKNPALCRCGASSNKPFCDGAHTKIGFK
ncbi:MAG TPA: hypothetical protein DDY13_03300 [Cytophagales bacterium]|nr:hypothetical protein [Cytophagales bacterium]